MAYEIEVLPSAGREIEALPRSIRTRIVRKIDALADNPRPSGVKRLHEEERLYRVRVGDYRVIYRIFDDRLIIVVVRVGHRGDVYRRKR